MDKVERFKSGLWPHLTTVQTHFGGWNDAVRAAGLDPTPASSYGRPGDDPEVVEKAVQAYRNGDGLYEAAERFRISSARLSRELAKRGDQAPSERLLDRLEDEVAEALAGRDWTSVATIVRSCTDAPGRIYVAMRNGTKTGRFELLEIAGRGLLIRLRR
jgi:hypothetical protein